ncbi:MAG: hypothetical protein WD824_14115 [Cyclobacteriaceae bacterium]
MKFSVLFVALLIAGISGSLAQSHSFQSLEGKFSSSENVHAFKTSGFFARTVLWMAGEQILIDNPDEVVAVEIKGYIDADLLTNSGHKLSYKL